MKYVLAVSRDDVPSKVHIRKSSSMVRSVSRRFQGTMLHQYIAVHRDIAVHRANEKLAVKILSINGISTSELMDIYQADNGEHIVTPYWFFIRDDLTENDFELEAV